MHRCTGGVCTTALALIFVNIAPTVFKAFHPNSTVIFTQRIQRIIARLLRIGKGNLAVRAGKQGSIHIIEMQFIHTQQLLAQAHIAMHLIHVIVNSFDQIQIDRSRHIGAIQRSIQCGRILSGISKELQLLALCVQQRCGGVLKAT